MNIPKLLSLSMVLCFLTLNCFAESEWDFASGDAQTPHWCLLHGLSVPEIESGKGLVLSKTKNDPHIGWTVDIPDGRQFGQAAITMQLNSPDSPAVQTAQFYWATDDRGFCEEQSVKFPVQIDGQEHTYTLDLWSNLLWDRDINAIRIDPVDNFFDPSVNIAIKSVRLEMFSDEQLQALENPVALHCPSKASPNGDGIRDELLRASLAREAQYTVILDGEAELMSGTGSRIELTWDGRLPDGARVQEGTHTIELHVSSPIMKDFACEIYLEDHPPWPQLPEKDWHKERPVGIWFDGRVEGYNVPPGCVNAPKDYDEFRQYYRSCFSDIASKGIDLIVIPNTPGEGQYRDIILQEAEKTGVQVVLEILEFVEYIRHAPLDEDTAEEMVREITSDLKGYSSLYAYQLIDEPPSELFEKMNLIARILARYDPDRPCFSTLCHDNSVTAFAKNVSVPFVIFDRYTLAAQPRPDDGDWVHLRNAVTNVRKDSGDKPTWFVIQTFAIPGRLRFPNVEEVKREIDICIEEGCTGIFFFLYNSDTQTEHLEGLVDKDYQSTDLWDDFSQVVDYARQRLSQ